MPFVVYGNGTRRFPLYGTTSDEKKAVKESLQYVSRVLFGFLFDIISGAWIIAEIYYPRKTIQAVADGDIERFAEYPIALT